MLQLVHLRTFLAGDIVLAGKKDAVLLCNPTNLTFITLLLGSLSVIFIQLALESETTAELELSLVLEQMSLALYPFLRQSDPRPA